MSLAETLAGQGQTAPAVEQYREILRQKPDYVAAGIALADLLGREHRYAEAIGQIDQALTQQPRNALLQERKGDLEQAQRQTAEAGKSWNEARRLTEDDAARKRIKHEPGRR